MEFTTKTTEQDYVAAYRLRFKPFLMVLNVAFFVVFGLALYLCVIVFIIEPGSPWIYFFAFMLPCLLGFKMYIPYLVRRIYRLRLNQQGEAINELTSKGISKSPMKDHCCTFLGLFAAAGGNPEGSSSS